MRDLQQENMVLDRLIRWVQSDPAIRAMILTSTRSDPGANLDIFSDYDVVLAVNDIRPFHRNNGWLEVYGPVLVVYRNPIACEDGLESFVFVTHYDDGVKIDYSFVTAEYIRRVSAAPGLPDDLDHGYRVLVDKDHLADGWKEPSHTAYIPTPPTPGEYRELIDEFLNDAIYVAKNLWRGHLLPVKLSLDEVMVRRCLRIMLEWRMEIDHSWSLKPGAHGKGLQGWVAPERWKRLESTYVGAGWEENWQALYSAIDLFREVTGEVGSSLGYAYPDDEDRRVLAYLRKIQQMGR